MSEEENGICSSPSSSPSSAVEPPPAGYPIWWSLSTCTGWLNKYELMSSFILLIRLWKDVASFSLCASVFTLDMDSEGMTSFPTMKVVMKVADAEHSDRVAQGGGPNATHRDCRILRRTLSEESLMPPLWVPPFKAAPADPHGAEEEADGAASPGRTSQPESRADTSSYTVPQASALMSSSSEWKSIVSSEATAPPIEWPVSSSEYDL